MEVPKRRYEMVFTIGADGYQEMLSAMQNFIRFMEREYTGLAQNHHGVSGGPDSGYSYDITFNPEMNHERYFEELNAYLDEKRKEDEPQN